MTTTASYSPPVPAGATDVSEWADVGHPDQFRTFTGPEWVVGDLVVQVYGTQLFNGTVEQRCVRALIHWDDELDSATASELGHALLAAACALTRLEGGQ